MNLHTCAHGEQGQWGGHTPAMCSCVRNGGELSKLQREILKASESYVKPGGVLVYSTCTVTPEENMNNVKWFLENFSFETESIDEYIPEKFRDENTAKGSLLLLPNTTEGHDGFFITRFRRKK